MILHDHESGKGVVSCGFPCTVRSIHRSRLSYRTTYYIPPTRLTLNKKYSIIIVIKFSHSINHCANDIYTCFTWTLVYVFVSFLVLAFSDIIHDHLFLKKNQEGHALGGDATKERQPTNRHNVVYYLCESTNASAYFTIPPGYVKRVG